MPASTPAYWDQLPPAARTWADLQASNDNEMLTALDGGHEAELQANYAVYVAELS
ncbi:hypothetical protein [Streptomyces coeruleorubidus]|uniref:hypothetical protein n=1 Tax=Streptomyces coeruleorubidus TaxID=116188 RepID=UPI0033CD8155